MTEEMWNEKIFTTGHEPETISPGNKQYFQTHRCKQEPSSSGASFVLGYIYDNKEPQNSYHFIVDPNIGSRHKVNYCPWCGEKIQ